MRYCIYCGSQHDEGYAFCPKCGKPVFDIDAFIKGELAEPTSEPKPEEPLPAEEEVIEEAPVVVEAEPIVEEKPVEAEAVIEEEPEEVADEAEEAPEEIQEEAQEEIPEEVIEEQSVEEPVQEEVPEEEPQAEEAPEEQPQVEEIPEEQPIEESVEEEEKAPVEEKPEPKPEEEPEPEPEPAPKPEPVVEKPQPAEKPATNMGDGKMKDKKSVDVPQQYQPVEEEEGKLLRIPFIALVIAAFACTVVGLGMQAAFEYSFAISGAGALLALVNFILCLIMGKRDLRPADAYFAKVIAFISFMVFIADAVSTVLPIILK